MVGWFFLDVMIGCRPGRQAYLWSAGSWSGDMMIDWLARPAGQAAAQSLQALPVLARTAGPVGVDSAMAGAGRVRIGMGVAPAAPASVGWS